MLTKDEARRIAVNIAKLPGLLGRKVYIARAFRFLRELLRAGRPGKRWTVHDGLTARTRHGLVRMTIMMDTGGSRIDSASCNGVIPGTSCIDTASCDRVIDSSVTGTITIAGSRVAIAGVITVAAAITIAGAIARVISRGVTIAGTIAVRRVAITTIAISRIAVAVTVV
jgi:hypothetical protein